MPPDPSALADRIEAALEPLAAELHRAWWDASVDVSPETERRHADLQREERDFFADPEAFAEIEGALEDARGDPAADDLAVRRLDVLRRAFLPNQVPDDLRHRISDLEASVHAAFSSFRGHVDGREVSDNEIAAVLSDSADDEERRSHWEASKQVGAEVAERVRELTRLRNEAARAVGYRDHYALALATGELDEDRLIETLDAIDRATARPFNEWKAAFDGRLAARFGCAVGELGPWHYGDPFFQQAPQVPGADLHAVLSACDIEDLAVRTYDGLGIEVRGVIEGSDLYPRERKTQHAFCLDVDRRGDVRVLCNIQAGERWAETTLHELGHAVYDLGVDPGLPWLLRRAAHALTTEGTAMWFGRLVRDPDWLRDVVGLPPAEAEARRAPLAQARRAALLVFARWVLVMLGFERGLYADPDADHDTRWWELVARFQHVRPPEGRRNPDWAAKIHVAVVPVYYQNYMYGELFASQVDAALRGVARGRVDDPAVGRWFGERVFRPGASWRWDRLVEEVTGRPLGADAFAADLTG